MKQTGAKSCPEDPWAVGDMEPGFATFGSPAIPKLLEWHGKGKHKSPGNHEGYWVGVQDTEVEAGFSTAAVPVQCAPGEGDPDSWGYPTWSIHTCSSPAMVGQAVQKTPTSKSVPLLS